LISNSNWTDRVGLGVTAAFLLLLLISPASAQAVITPLQRPSAASIIVPDMGSFKPTPRDARNFDDYFYFHKDGVSYEDAFADLEQCRINAAMAQLIPDVPDVIPVGDAATNNTRLSDRTFPFFGMVGGFLIAGAEEDNAILTNRKCMAYKGYRRYGTSRALFKQIDSGSDAEKQARKALIASGAVPAIEAIGP